MQSVPQTKHHRKAYGAHRNGKRHLVTDIFDSICEHPDRTPEMYTQDPAIIEAVQRRLEEKQLAEVNHDVQQWADADDLEFYTDLLSRMHPDSVCLPSGRRIHVDGACPLPVEECPPCQDLCLHYHYGLMD